tara:strand:- start:80 stop:310 length:231 start_codon:yes stop_codon:yes gene_type:complete
MIKANEIPIVFNPDENKFLFKIIAVAKKPFLKNMKVKNKRTVDLIAGDFETALKEAGCFEFVWLAENGKFYINKIK